MSAVPTFRTRSPRLRTLTAAGLAGLVLAGCASTPTGSTEPTGGSSAASFESPAISGPAPTGTVGEAVVDVAITDAGGCVASPDTVAAGAVTFNVRNVDAVGVSEVELLSDQRIRGERENLAPGFDATFSATLDGGSYEIYCPAPVPTGRRSPSPARRPSPPATPPPCCSRPPSTTPTTSTPRSGSSSPPSTP